MTKVTVFGKEAQKKKIEFHASIDKSFNKTILSANPSDYEKLTLLVPKYMGNYDLMLAEGYCCRHLFIGHFNDGVV